MSSVVSTAMMETVRVAHACALAMRNRRCLQGLRVVGCRVCQESLLAVNCFR
jgi:hypothetical protein